MIDDVYTNPTKVYFGKGCENMVGEKLAQHTDRVLLHYGGGSAERTGLLGRIRKSLEEAGVQYFELGGVQPNPRLDLVYEGIRLCRDESIGFLLAVGGGSAIDSAKAIAMGVPNSEDVWNYMITPDKPEVVLPVATVLTIPGAGSESSDGCVITNDETGVKAGISFAGVRPVVSFLNPELTYTVPAYHYAAGICDAMAHVFERYFTNTTSVDVTDRLCEGVLRSLMKYARRALDEPENYDARAAIMWGCKMAHDGSLGVGREEDWATHFIEHELSARYDVSHGAGLAVLFPAWMTYVYKHDVDRFAQFAMRVLDVEYDFSDPERTVLEGIRRLKAFFASLDMPVSMEALCPLKKEEVSSLAQDAADNSGGELGKFVRLGKSDIEKICLLAYAE